MADREEYKAAVDFTMLLLFGRYKAKNKHINNTFKLGLRYWTVIKHR